MPFDKGMYLAWEVDWLKGASGSKFWARNPQSRVSRCREWHWTSAGFLRTVGVATPTYRKDSWEVDWTHRQGKLVFARNLASKMPSARTWHFVDFHTLTKAGIAWKPKHARAGRRIAADGYVTLSRTAMTGAEIALADQHGLWRGKRRAFLKEHHLVATQKYGAIKADHVVRHINGVKHDNCPENLCLGTSAENTMDHVSARRAVAYWRDRCLAAEAKLATTRVKP